MFFSHDGPQVQDEKWLPKLVRLLHTLGRSKGSAWLLIERAFIVTYLLSISHVAEVNEESVRVRLGQKGCGWNRVKELERKER